MVTQMLIIHESKSAYLKYAIFFRVHQYNIWINSYFIGTIGKLLPQTASYVLIVVGNRNVVANIFHHDAVGKTSALSKLFKVISIIMRDLTYDIIPVFEF